MRSILFTMSAVVVLASTTTGALAESGETAVVESRASLVELWGRTQPESDRAEAAAEAATLHRDSTLQVHIARSPNVWADNYAAGRVHEPADHE